MLTLKEAEELLNSCLPAKKKIFLPPEEALGSVLAEDIIDPRPSPPAPRALMDGFALSSALAASRRGRLAVAGMALAGEPQKTLVPQTAMEIATGAILPLGADAVVAYEEACRQGHEVELSFLPLSSHHVEQTGAQHAAGAVVLDAGTELKAPAIAALASAGRDKAPVWARPKVALLATGDEILPLGIPAAGHQVYASHGPAMVSALRKKGYDAQASLCRDEPESLAKAMEKNLLQSEVLLVTGGISKGRADRVPSTLAALGAEIIFREIAVRPGKPFLFARCGDKAIFGLPGQPQSALITFFRLVLPWLEKSQGKHVLPGRRYLKKGLISSPAEGWTWFVPVQESEEGLVPAASASSGDWGALARSDGFVEVPAPVPQDAPLPFYPWGH